MERAMSVEDKIRRAEEIYYKRRMGEIGENGGVLGVVGGVGIGGRVGAGAGVGSGVGAGVGAGKIIGKADSKERNIKLFKRAIKQIIVCVIIYGIFYVTVNNNYVFSEDFTNKARDILNQDVDFKSMYSNIMLKVNEWSQKLNKETEQQKNNGEDNSVEDKSIENNNEKSNSGKSETGIDGENGEAIGGATEETMGESTGSTNEISQISQMSQMEQDANYIKTNIKFIKPINGKITSGFGIRNPTTASVPKNHTGTDIAAETGTKILSATEGKVTLASSAGDYGKHLQIQTNENDVVIVYAHCNNLYVNEGDSIKQGQEIAEVGSTGNATGPHLHFEVRYQNRYVDPQLILEL